MEKKEETPVDITTGIDVWKAFCNGVFTLVASFFIWYFVCYLAHIYTFDAPGYLPTLGGFVLLKTLVKFSVIRVEIVRTEDNGKNCQCEKIR